MNDRSSVEAIKATVPIEAVVSPYVRLTVRGRDRWGLCPFHAERTPSFEVRPALGTWRCFGACADGGDVIAFVMRAEGIDFKTAVDRLGGGSTGSAWQIAKRAPAPPLPVQSQLERAPWLADRGTRDLERFTSALGLVEAWRRYQPALTIDTILRWRFGLGVIPMQRTCPHARLIIPQFAGKTLSGFRGRRIDCGCDAKWLSAFGSRATLFGGELLQAGARVVIVESPVSAALLMQERPELTALAVWSAGGWRPEWTERVVTSRPESVRIWLDNDQAGLDNAIRRFEDFRRAGLGSITRIFRWPPGLAQHRDPADVVADTVLAGREGAA